MRKISSETKVLFDLIIGLLKTPFIFILALFGKREFKEVFLPVKNLVNHFFEPKATVFLCFLILISFFISLFLNNIDFFVLYPSDFYSIRFFSLVTHGFLHSGLSHLFSNLVIIYFFGRLVEKEYGVDVFLKTYFFGLVFAALFASVVNLYNQDLVGSVGASGAAMALVAVATLFKPFKISYVALIPLPVFLIGWVAVLGDITGIINASNDGIGYFAHLGGFLSAPLLFLMLGKIKEIKKGILINLSLILLVFIILNFL